MKTERITSRKNPLLQQIRRLLLSRKERYEAGLYAGDGMKLLQEAIRWCPGLHTVVISDDLEPPPVPNHVPVYQVPVDIMESLSPMKAPQGAIFLCRIPEKKHRPILPGTLILDGIQDPGNLGTILRTADAFSIPVILADGCADIYNWKTVRASMGAVFRSEPMLLSADDIIAQCLEARIPLATTALHSDAKDIRSMNLRDAAVVIGSEGQGVSKLFMNNCDHKMVIPMNPHCESLNAATAAAIVMWEMCKQSNSPF